ncbi:4-diphosphocytidyl-2C-methyl-D-erythritol kinase [Candidatus Magnetomorum sp. HK-1]|nr:4-diphosphocytidyl-2C-methyl-D-erythritol kinase [Candidatus Magnetomorum sp. HK-1]
MEQEYISPAKINFFLRITGKRSDGYHTLISLMSPISLHDTISMTFHTERIQVNCMHPDVPIDHKNLAYQAADIFFQATGIVEGVNIFIQKNIPVGGGLGGGSSNAATVLTALNKFYQSPLPEKKLKEIALSLGADVPFFIDQVTALATGIGERLHPVNISIKHSLALIYPGFPVSTAWTFKNLNLNLTTDKINDRSSNLIFKYKKKIKQLDWLSDIHNDLESVSFKRYPVLLTIKNKLISMGADFSFMSGSGSSIIGMFSDNTACQKACDDINQHSTWRAFACDVMNNKNNF